MSAALCQKETERLHRFFVDWFTGNVPNSPELLDQHCTCRFSDDFSMVNPLGRLISKPQLVIGLNHAYKTHPSDFEIHIHNCQILQNLSKELKLISYEEWQRSGNKTTARRATALLKVVEGEEIEWKYVHETWLEGKGPDDRHQGEAPFGTKIGTTSPVAVGGPAGATSATMTTTTTTKNTPRVTTLVSRRRHVSDKLISFGAVPVMNSEQEMIGIGFRNMVIITTQGPMANEGWLESTTTKLEEVCQFPSERRRRLNLPEVCFSQAAVSMAVREDITFKWTAFDALEDWSRAHQAIEVGSDTFSNGVSVLKGIDAALWSNKAVQTDFHYDWTYSTPFSVKIEGDATWKALDSSGMNIGLLTDTTQPILYFDDIALFEDDLHDYGVINLRVKLRAMPTCLYVLSRCWLRVDGMLLRCRETRVMVEFASQQIFRDITWRQCAWSELQGYNLPIDARAWKNEGASETAAWQALVNRLPMIDLPEGMPKHSVLEIRESMNCQ